MSVKRRFSKAHPLVEDVDAELKQLEKEAQEAQEKADAYAGCFDVILKIALKQIAMRKQMPSSEMR